MRHSKAYLEAWINQLIQEYNELIGMADYYESKADEIAEEIDKLQKEVDNVQSNINGSKKVVRVWEGSYTKQGGGSRE